MNVFRQEIKMNLKTALLWILVLCTLGLVFMSFYPIIQTDMKTFLKLMDNFPPALKAVMGIVTETFSTPLGYYSFALTFVVLSGAIQAMNLGVGIVSKETRDKTADFLLTKPISRRGILNAKIAASIVLLTTTGLVYSVFTGFVISAFAKGDIDVRKYVLLSLTIFFSQIIFYSIGLLVSVSARKIKAVLPVSLAIVFFFYALSAFAVTSESDKLRYITPFQYFKPEFIIQNGHYETAYLITGIAIVILSVLASYVWFCKKDVHSV
jgi:ABC-2 type transport system permease protein